MQVYDIQTHIYVATVVTDDTTAGEILQLLISKKLIPSILPQAPYLTSALYDKHPHGRLKSSTKMSDLDTGDTQNVHVRCLAIGMTFPTSICVAILTEGVLYQPFPRRARAPVLHAHQTEGFAAAAPLILNHHSRQSTRSRVAIRSRTSFLDRHRSPRLIVFAHGCLLCRRSSRVIRCAQLYLFPGDHD